MFCISLHHAWYCHLQASHVACVEGVLRGNIHMKYMPSHLQVMHSTGVYMVIPCATCWTLAKAPQSRCSFHTYLNTLCMSLWHLQTACCAAPPESDVTAGGMATLHQPRDALTAVLLMLPCVINAGLCSAWSPPCDACSANSSCLNEPWGGPCDRSC